MILPDDDTEARSHVKVVSIDIVKYSLRPPPLQHKIVRIFTRHLTDTRKYLSSVPGNDKIEFLPLGDGVLVIFLDTVRSHDIHTRFASEFLVRIDEHNRETQCQLPHCLHPVTHYCQCDKYDIRIGIAQGLAVPFTDINGRHNYAGTPLNEASRIMGLAPMNQIAISGCVFDEIGGYLPQDEKQLTECSGMIKHGKDLKFYIWGRPPKDVTEDAVKELNQLFADQNRIETLLSANPKPMEIHKPVAISHEALQAKRAELHQLGKPNLSHALLENFYTHHSPPRLEYYTVDFATVEILRALAREADNLDLLPKVVSCSAIVCCSEQRRLVLHHRPSISRTYPNCLHTLGSGFKPKTVEQSYFALYDPDLMTTALREVMEESGLAIQWRKNVPLWWLFEKQTGFVQLLLSGVGVTGDNLSTMESSWDGRLLSISFDDLEDAVLLRMQFGQGFRVEDGLKWTPTALLSILLWLAGGAHGAGDDPLFNGKKATILYHSLIEAIRAQGLPKFLGEPFAPDTRA
ncbi:MAG: hypothetical protein HQL95_05675 [Magnetococcales bacterium]|nr:hypothetical protein [Magnetococcales bacterium]